MVEHCIGIDGSTIFPRYLIHIEKDRHILMLNQLIKMSVLLSSLRLNAELIRLDITHIL